MEQLATALKLSTSKCSGVRYATRLLREGALHPKQNFLVRKLFQLSKLLSKLTQLKFFTNGGLGAEHRAAGDDGLQHFIITSWLATLHHSWRP